MRQYTYKPEIEVGQLPALEQAVQEFNQTQANIFFNGEPVPLVALWTERVIGRDGKLTAHVCATSETQILQVGILAGKYLLTEPARLQEESKEED